MQPPRESIIMTTQCSLEVLTVSLFPPVPNISLKEWAVAVKALANGKQTIILRKGGIYQGNKEFRVIHPKLLAVSNVRASEDRVTERGILPGFGGVPGGR